MKVSIPLSGSDPTIISGFQDDFLRTIQARFDIAVSMRDDYIHLKGAEKNVRAAEKVVRSRLSLNNGETQSGTGEPDDREHISEQGSSVSTPKRLIRAKSPGQADYIKAIDQHDIVVSIGPAGTGKTYLAVAKAVSFLIDRKVERLILTRPAVEAGESLGFLPGAIEEKVDPYLRPLYDALNDFLPYDRIRRYLDTKTIEVAPLAYMRGRTLNDAFIILDEAQNTTGMQMKMFLTRMGWRSKVVVTGDITQVDLPPNVISSLIEIQHLLKNVNGIEFLYLSEMDVVRHNLVQKIIRAYEAKNST